ncbi:MAG: hypothetical protein SPJ79_05470 [Prevotella sp.]|nr:hypothetical protein [Prevotella sp.]
MQTVGHKSLWQHRWQADGRRLRLTGRQQRLTGRRQRLASRQAAETGRQAETGLTFTTRQESKGE